MTLLMVESLVLLYLLLLFGGRPALV